MHSNAVLAKALQGGKQLTRAELVSVLQRASIVANNLLRFTYIIMRAELDGIICSGARRDKQFTYALLDERAPQARMLDRDEALARACHHLLFPRLFGRQFGGDGCHACAGQLPDGRVCGAGSLQHAGR